MIEIFGAITGFLGATIPNLFKLWQDKIDKKHEITIMKLQMEASEKLGHDRLAEIEMNAQVAESNALYQTFYSGIKWVDAFNATVRPSLAYSFFMLYAFVKVALILQSPENGLFLSVKDIWGETDNVIFLTIISYFFGQRAMAKLAK